MSVDYYSPLPALEVQRFARLLRGLLAGLAGEVVTAALVGECEPDLLGAERQEVDRVREFLHGRVPMRSEPSDLRRCALAVLDAFEYELASATEVHESSSSSGDGDAPSVGGEPPAAADSEEDAAAGAGPQRVGPVEVSLGELVDGTPVVVLEVDGARHGLTEFEASALAGHLSSVARAIRRGHFPTQ